MVALEEFGRRQPQHRIAEEFQLFVVEGQPCGRVAEGLIQGRQRLGAAGGRIEAQAGEKGQQLPPAIGRHRDGRGVVRAGRGGWGPVQVGLARG